MKRMQMGWAAVVAIAAAGCSFAWAQSPAQAAGQDRPPAVAGAATGSKMVLASDVWDFGMKLSGEPAEGEIRIENQGSAPLRFTINTSCGCAVPQLEKATRLLDQEFQYMLEPGQSDKLKITYNTKKKVRKVTQTITITSNDIEKPSTQVRVQGEVVELFESTVDGNPMDRLQFPRLDGKSAETREMVLKNNTDTPVALKLRATPANAPFSAELVEITPGREYKIVAKTVPPMRAGTSTTDLELETDHPTLKELKFTLSAYVQPRVALTRSSLAVAATTTTPIKQRLQVRYLPNNPVKITGFQAEPTNITATVLPEPPNRQNAPSAGMAFYDVEVTIPPAAELPKEGGKLYILTNDAEEEFQRLEVKIIVVNAPQRAAAPAPRPGAAAPAGKN